MDKEQWKDITGYEGLYQVSNMGRVASYDRVRKDGVMYKGCIKKLSLNGGGYLIVSLYNYSGKKMTFLVARLVAIAFIPNPDNKTQVNHKNGIKIDNRVENLEWATRNENCQHAYDTGLNFGPIGESQGNAKLTENDVRIIRELISMGDLTYKEIGEMFGIGDTAVYRIKIGRTWKHI